MGDGGRELDNGLCALSQLFLDDGTFDETLLRVAGLACDISAADMAGITLLTDGRPEHAVFTDPAARDLDTAQYGSGGGPGLDAFRDEQVYRVDVIRSEERWPEFIRDTAARGIAASLSTPLIARGKALGALNLYSRGEPFDDVSLKRVEIFAQRAAIVLANTKLYWDARNLSQDIQQAMRFRATIDQAMGILMADGSRSPDEAFQFLVRVSQRENRKLRDIASDVVSRVTERTWVDRPRPGSGPAGPDSGQ